MAKQLTLKRRETFCASHRLYNPELTEEENNALYQKCARHHGHNYVLIVSVTGKVDEDKGMIIEFEEIKQAMQQTIQKMDHRHLNDLEAFKNVQTTVENIVQFIWDLIEDDLPNHIELKEIELQETEKNTVILTAD